MAGNGPAPRTNAPMGKKKREVTTVSAPSTKRGKPLPKNFLTDRYGEPESWHPATQEWWNNWRTSPQATRMMTDVDWDFLLDTALMHHNMWKTRKWELASEIRLRVAKFGATPEDRKRLQLEIEEDRNPSVGTRSGAQNVTSIESRRGRIANA